MPKEKKGIYHSELVQLGQTTVDVMSDVLDSKFKKGTHYIKLLIEGTERDYFIENDVCAAELTDRKGQRLTIEAIGTREAAEIIVHAAEFIPEGEARPAARPAPAQTRPAPARPAQAAARPQPTASPAAARPVRNDAPAARPAAEKAGTKAQLTKLGNLIIHCECAAKKVAEILLLDHKIDTSDESHKSRVAMLFIQMTRDNYHHQQKSDAFLTVSKPVSNPPAEESEPAEGEE